MMMIGVSKYRVTARARIQPAGTYTFRITKSDNPSWFEESIDSYPTPDAALSAGHERLAQLERGS
jgi:hypothetical protein